MERNASTPLPPWMEEIVGYAQRELGRPEIHQRIIAPLVKRILWAIFPYGVGFLLLNFFIMILAVGIVLLFWNRKII